MFDSRVELSHHPLYSCCPIKTKEKCWWDFEEFPTWPSLRKIIRFPFFPLRLCYCFEKLQPLFLKRDGRSDARNRHFVCPVTSGYKKVVLRFGCSLQKGKVRNKQGDDKPCGGEGRKFVENISQGINCDVTNDTSQLTFVWLRWSTHFEKIQG